MNFRAIPSYAILVVCVIAISIHKASSFCVMSLVLKMSELVIVVCVIAIRIHKECKDGLKTCRAVSDRIWYADVKPNQEQLRIVAAHTPHGRYTIAEVMQVYDQLRQIVKDGQRKGLKPIMRGYWHAVIGQQSHMDGTNSAGT